MDWMAVGESWEAFVKRIRICCRFGQGKVMKILS